MGEGAGVRHIVLLLVSKTHLMTTPVGGGDDILSKLLLVLRVDETHGLPVF